MIRFDNWIIQADGEIIARQFDNLTRTLTVTGDIPAGWEWAVLVQVGNAMDIIPLTATEGTLSVVLTAKQLSIAGCYQMQLRATQGELVKHTNTITVYIPASLSGDERWPTVPSEFTQMEQRMKGYAEHPPVIGENDTWLLWNGAGYVDSGKPSRGCEISNIAFDGSVGRWVVTYTDGTSETFAGYDPADSTVWSFVKEDFERYDSAWGSDFMSQTIDWRVDNNRPTGNVSYNITDTGKYKCLNLNAYTSDSIASMVLNHPVQGEHIVEFDYSPMHMGAVGDPSDFFDVRLFTFGELAISARVNFKGISRIYTAVTGEKQQSPIITNVAGNHYTYDAGVWYRVKVFVRVGQIIMKVWERDSESEPMGISGPGVTSLALDLLTPELIATPHELMFYFWEFGGEPSENWSMRLDNVRVYRLNEGKPGRGISNIAFNSLTGRWEVHYTDGTSDSFAGYDPSNSAVWSIFREDFGSYEVGEDGFGLPGAETDNWRFSDTYVTGAGYGIGEDANGRYAILRCDKGTDSEGTPNRAAFTLQHTIQGEYTLQFDYKPTYSGKVIPSSTETDFFEVWPFGTTDSRFRARVNFRGISTIHSNDGDGYMIAAPFPASVKSAAGGDYAFSAGVWYRVKICVNVGRIIMKIWERDSGIEPADTSKTGVITLDSEIFSEEYLAVPHEIRFTFGPMLWGGPVDSWSMGFDNVKIWRNNEGKQGEKGDTGAPGRGIVNTVFDGVTGRWVSTYTDGSTETQAGYDPANSSIWSVFRDDFSRYSIGENVFEGQAKGDWTKDSYYAAQAYLDVAEDNTNKYVVFRTTGSSTRVSALINHYFQGEYTIQFDYMALTESNGNSGSIFEAWLLDGNVRARVNFSGKRNSIHVNQSYSTLAPANTWMPDYLIDTNVWYRVKISVQVGKILMKIWKRDTESEPTEGAAGTVALESEVITEEQILNEKRIRMMFGPMGTTPSTEGHRMGLDNVRIYRDITAALSLYRGEFVSLNDIYNGEAEEV